MMGFTSISADLMSFRRCFLLLCLLGCWCRTPAQLSALQQYVGQAARSLDFAPSAAHQLAFLDSLLQNKRIVLLGESSHGTEEYSQVKLELIRYLHQKLGFRVVLFESPIVPGAYFQLAADTAQAADLVRNCLQDVWHTYSVRELFGYLQAAHMAFGGFDPQCIPSPYNEGLFEAAFPDEPALQQEAITLERSVAAALAAGGQYATLKDSFSNRYSHLTRQLSARQLTPIQRYVQQIASSSADYYARLHAGNQRDSSMARNLIWLAEQYYPHEKIVVWAHNAHIDNDPQHKARFMGKLLAAHFKEQLYTIGLYMGSGSTALNNRQVIPVKRPLKGSLEALLGHTGLPVAFLETRNAHFDRKIRTWHWGKDRHRLNLARSYDAVIFIRQVSPARYLPE